MDTEQYFNATIQFIDSDEKLTRTLAVNAPVRSIVDNDIFYYFENKEEMRGGSYDFKVLDYVNITSSFLRQHSISI